MSIQTTPGSNPILQGGFAASRFIHGMELPYIRGNWFFVDPKAGVDTNTGDTVENAFATLKTAYAACTDGVGDGICFLSGSLSTATYSDALLAPIEWSKWGITLFGVAGGGYNSRARVTTHAAVTSAVSIVTASVGTLPTTITRTSGSFIDEGWKVGMTGVYDAASAGSANSTFVLTAVSALVLTCTTHEEVADESATTRTLVGYFPYLINFTGSNNRILNMYFINEASHALNIGSISVAAARNKFVNCHMSSNNTLGSAAVACYDVRLSASETQFLHCWFGNNNTARSGAANGNITLGLSTTQLGQNYFEDCYILSYSVTTTHGAVKVADVATLGGWISFKRCSFINWNNAKTFMATIIIGATPTNWGIAFDHCSSFGYTAVGANDDMWYVTPYGSAVGVGTLGTTLS